MTLLSHDETSLFVEGHSCSINPLPVALLIDPFNAVSFLSGIRWQKRQRREEGFA
jgi:hypothetical protein